MSEYPRHNYGVVVVVVVVVIGGGGIGVAVIGVAVVVIGVVGGVIAVVLLHSVMKFHAILRYIDMNLPSRF
jgi:hypothetical protein